MIDYVPAMWWAAVPVVALWLAMVGGETGILRAGALLAIAWFGLQVADAEWRTLYLHIRQHYAVSALTALHIAYWSGYGCIALPGAVWTAAIGWRRFDVPRQVDQWGGLACGAAAGLLLMLAVAQSFLFQYGSHRTFRKSFEVLQVAWVMCGLEYNYVEANFNPALLESMSLPGSEGTATESPPAR